jgi:uncharacterized membrane protein (UPF0182 family)
MTVGYGDITAQRPIEWIFCIILMTVGVVSFSFATGSISSIIANHDSAEAKLKLKMSMLDSINKDYQLPEDLFNKMLRIIKYDHTKKKKDTKEVQDFIDEFPEKIRAQVKICMYRQTFRHITFLEEQDDKFVEWAA